MLHDAVFARVCRAGKGRREREGVSGMERGWWKRVLSKVKRGDFEEVAPQWE